MSISEDAIERADGSSGIYGVVEKPDFALVVPVDRGGFHLVQQYRYPVRGHYLEFPQGSWEERPETDPLEVARGELEEETGLRAGTLRHLGHLFEAYGYCTQGFHIFLATDLTTGQQMLSPEEQDVRTRWVGHSEFWSLVQSGELKDAPSLAAYALLMQAPEFR